MNTEYWLNRTEILLGKEKLSKLENAHVLVAGLGGVGGYAVEQLCRAGIGKLTIVDADVVMPGNRNRQIIALKSTENKPKAEVFRERLMDINPGIKLIVIHDFIGKENIDRILDDSFDYIVDAIDTLSPKTQLLTRALGKGFGIVSSMGAGGKLDPSQVRVADIADTYNCRLASALRRTLRKAGVNTGIRVVFSPEQVSKSAGSSTEESFNKKSVVGTISYMPPLFGCYCAAEVIRSLLK